MSKPDTRRRDLSCVSREKGKNLGHISSAWTSVQTIRVNLDIEHLYDRYSDCAISTISNVRLRNTHPKHAVVSNECAKNNAGTVRVSRTDGEVRACLLGTENNKVKI